MKPGRKGVSLKDTQWQMLIGNAASVEAAFDDL
jgi:hypothetical protein